MAQQINNVLQGQVTPQARPVDAFIRPSETNVAQPNQLPRLGQPSQINTISTGGTNNVAGVNKFAQLAQDLAEFNPQLTKTLQTMGVMYADSQIKAGERYAREQALKALANNDNQMEAAELDRAAQNRRLGAKDPNAGTIMASLNPYFGMGVERGNAKLAAAKAESGFLNYVATKGNEIDYSAPDMGFGALVRLEAEYTQELAQEWGLSAGSPGFQKYTLPAVEKARDQANDRLLKDRKDYYDTVAVSQAASLIKQIYQSSDETGYVELNGVRISRSQDPKQFETTRRLLADVALQNLVLRASAVGEGAKRAGSVYSTLSKDALYNASPQFQSFIDSLPGTEFEKGLDGKAVVGSDGQPRRLPMGVQYRDDSIDLEIKYGAAAAQRDERQRDQLLTEPGKGFDDVVTEAAGDLPDGPERMGRITSAVNQWWEANGRPAGLSRSSLIKRANDLVKERNDFNYLADDPSAVEGFWTRLEQNSFGSAFNATQLRAEAQSIGRNIRDPQERREFLKNSNQAITEREKEQASMSPYARVRDGELNRIIDANIKEWYDASDPDQKQYINRSTALQRSALTSLANTRLLELERQKGRKLTETEVMQVTRGVFFGDKTLGLEPYGKGRGGGRPGSRVDDLFPGSPRSSALPPMGPDGIVPSRQYSTSELQSAVPDRRIFQNYKGYRILTADSTLEAWKMLSGGKVLPRPLMYAVSASGAKSPGEFVLSQMNLWRQSMVRLHGAGSDEAKRFQVTEQQRNRVLRTSAGATSGGRTAQSVSSNVQGTPLLAQLGGWALSTLTGAAPAAAATMPQQMPTSGRVPGRPSSGASRPPQPQAYPLPASYPALGAAPAAPVLPAPAIASRPSGSPPAGGASDPAGQVVGLVQPSRGRNDVSGGVSVTSDQLPPGWTLDANGFPQLAMSSRQVENRRVLATREIELPAYMGGGGGFEKPVSVVYERSGGQPGVDLYFPSKRFPAVLGGVVKDVRREPGYGNYVVVESIDPLTGKRVDVLYGHLADGVTVRPGQRIQAGQVIGQQGGTGNVRSADGTIASVDFFEPRPAGSRDMTPYSGFDRLRRHVVATLQQGGGGGGVGGQKPDGYLKRLAYLETRIRNIPNAEGSPGRGYFQAFPAFSQEAIAASGGIDPRDGDYGRSAKSTWAWIQKHRPEAAAAIKRGDYETADRILRPTWPSLPGGSQAQPDYVQREARRYLN